MMTGKHRIAPPNMKPIPPAPRPAIAACPLIKCGYVAVRPTKEEAQAAERRHWDRAHKEEGDE